MVEVELQLPRRVSLSERGWTKHHCLDQTDSVVDAWDWAGSSLVVVVGGDRCSKPSAIFETEGSTRDKQIFAESSRGAGDCIGSTRSASGGFRFNWGANYHMRENVTTRDVVYYNLVISQMTRAVMKYDPSTC